MVRLISDSVTTMQNVPQGGVAVLVNPDGAVMEASDPYNRRCQELNCTLRLLLRDGVAQGSAAGKQELKKELRRGRPGLASNMAATVSLYNALPARATRHTVTAAQLPAPSGNRVCFSQPDAFRVLENGSFTFEGACRSVLYFSTNRSACESKGLLPPGSASYLEEMRAMLIAVASRQAPGGDANVDWLVEWDEAYVFKQAMVVEEAHPLGGRHAGALLEIMQQAVAANHPCVTQFKHVAAAAVAAAEAYVRSNGDTPDTEDAGDGGSQAAAANPVGTIRWQ